MNSSRQQTDRAGRHNKGAGVGRLMAFAVVFGAGATRGDAQLTDLNEIRGRNNFTDADRQRITRAVDGVLKNIADATSQGDRMKPARDFRNIWGDLSSPNFKDEYVKIASKQLADRMLNDPGEAVLVVLLELRAYQHDRTIPAMRTALQHSWPPVRYLAAQAIRDLWATLPAQEVKPTVDAIAQAGQVEKDSLVVREMYRTLATAKDSPEILPAMLTIFEARLKGYARRSGWQADQEACDYFLSKLAGLNEETRGRLVNGLARLLAQAVPQFLVEAADPELSQDQERLISAHVVVDAAERLLTALVGTPEGGVPNLRKALQNGIQSGPEAIQLELARWIGKGDVPGVLNKAPFNVPVGGGVPAEPTTQASGTTTASAPAGG